MKVNSEDDGTSWELSTNDPRFVFLATWAAKNGARLQLDGTCGFGRECMGIAVDSQYLDYSHLWEEFRGVEHWTPEDAYHKHECMAVLGRSEETFEQLYQWAKWYNDHNWHVVEQARPQAPDMLSLFLHGTRLPKLMPPAPVL